MQPDGSFRLSSLCWVEGHLQNPTPLWRQAALGRGGWLSVPACPAGEGGEPWAIQCGLEAHAWAHSRHQSPWLRSEDRQAQG